MAAIYASSTLSGLMPLIHIIVVVVSPTTLPAAAGIGGCDDRGQIADVNLSTEDVARHRSPDERGRDIVEEARQNEDDDEKDSAAFPVIRQQGRHLIRNPALLEMPRQQSKSHQQQEQIGQRDPLVRH